MAILDIYCIYWTVWDRYMQVPYLGRAPRTKETLPDFREKCRVTRHSRAFRGLTGSQRTPRFWGVTNMGLPSEANWLVSFLKQSWSSSEMICWPISQPNSPEYHPVKFLSKTFSLFFQFFMSCTHLISRLPQCI